jgi:hypothetical protein
VWCCRELTAFHAREQALGRNDLIFPLHYIDSDGIAPEECADPSALALLHSRHNVDFRGLRLADPHGVRVLRTVENLANAIRSALRGPLPPSSARGPMPPSSASAAQPSWLSVPTLEWRPSWSPGALLRADVAGGVPFHGREAEQADLDAWCAADGDVAVRLYTAAGGMGKTRLGIETCLRQQQRGWHAGFLGPEPAVPPDETIRHLLVAAVPVLVVVDYAEGRLDALRALLRAVLTARRNQPIRFLLLARDRGEWWDDLAASGWGLETLLLGPAASAVRLRPVATSLDLRRETFTLAGSTFAERLGRPFDDAPPTDLEDTHYERILLIHMAALAQVDGVQVTGENGIISCMLARERHYLELLLRDRSLPLSLLPAVVNAVAVLFAIDGAGSEDDAMALLRLIPRFMRETEAVIYTIAGALHDAYGGAAWIDRLQPDLLGEHLVAAEERRRPNSVLRPALAFAKRNKAA